MPAKHFVIYVPGLADRTVRQLGQQWLIKLWRKRFKIATAYHTVKWADQEQTFTQKLQKLLDKIDDSNKKGYTVSLVASSAGALLALHAFALRRNMVHRVVLIAGKIKNPTNVAEAVFNINPAFKDALQKMPQALNSLTTTDRARVLLVKPRSDNIVPLPDTDLKGANTLHIKSRGHLWAIVAGLTIHSKRLVRFIKQK